MERTLLFSGDFAPDIPEKLSQILITLPAAYGRYRWSGRSVPKPSFEGAGSSAYRHSGTDS